MSFELPRKGIVLPPEIPLEELWKFLGEYHGDELDETLEIVIKNNSLALKISGQKTYELRPPDAVVSGVATRPVRSLTVRTSPAQTRMNRKMSRTASRSR